MEQCDALQDGRIPAGVRPFKISVNVPELDEKIPAELCLIKFKLTEGSTFREAKEKLHIAAIALNKAIDTSVIEHQTLSLKNYISCGAFVAG